MQHAQDKISIESRKIQESLPRRAGTWGLLGLLLGLLGCAPEAVRYPQPSMAIWANHNGGTIEGGATLRSGATGYARTCAGFDAYIIPVTPSTTAFMQKHFKQIRNGYAPAPSLQDELGMFVTANGGGRVNCRDDGTFAFANLAEGQYYVLADIRWLLRWAHRGGTVSTVADVRRAQSSSIAIDVSSTTRSETPDVP
ncbi:MAG: hypothetical protein V4559_10695 [Pseudomonadota bacterium]